MTWKERRNVTILLCIAGALFLALLVVFGMIYREGLEEAIREAAEKGKAEVLSLLMNEKHQRFPEKRKKRFEL